MPADLPYRDFLYPLNVFMHVLTREEGGVSYLHYGLFENSAESIAVAQERSTKLLLANLPPPPARILEVGIGLGTTLERLMRLGYDAVGITPDAKQIAMARERFEDMVKVENVAFEHFAPRPFDTIVFQESSQYIDASSLFPKASEIADDVLVIDEFSTGDGALHRLDEFLLAAKANGYRETEEIDLSAKAAPTVDYFMERLERYRPALITDLALTNDQVDALIASGALYRQRYAEGAYVYRLMRFRR